MQISSLKKRLDALEERQSVSTEKESTLIDVEEELSMLTNEERAEYEAAFEEKCKEYGITTEALEAQYQKEGIKIWDRYPLLVKLIGTTLARYETKREEELK